MKMAALKTLSNKTLDTIGLLERIIMEKVYFADNLIKPILNKEKSSTWRINEEVPFRRSNTSGLKNRDEISLCNNDGEEFAQAVILEINDTIFGNLTEDDKSGHEDFSSDEEMYKVYSKYYKTEIGPKSKIRIIKFEIK